MKRSFPLRLSEFAAFGRHLAAHWVPVGMLLISGCTEINPNYCDQEIECANAHMLCDMAINTCIAPGDYCDAETSCPHEQLFCNVEEEVCVSLREDPAVALADGDALLDEGEADGILAVSPRPEAIDVPLESNIRITFDRAIDPETVQGWIIEVTREGLSGRMSGVLRRDGIDLTFEPDLLFRGDLRYRATVYGNMLRSQSGEQFSEKFTWAFRTERVIAVESLTPEEGAEGVPVTTTVEAVFSGLLEPSSIDDASFALFRGTEAVGVTRNVSRTRVILVPLEELEPDAIYTVVITSAVESMVGAPLAPAVRSWFRTAP